MSTDDGDVDTRPADESDTAARVLLALCAVTVAALLLRTVALGGRIFHWDEGRVGYWILRYGQTGEFAYRPIIHGPFLPIVNRYVFEILPASDFSARLVVALVGGLLPLAAWLFRDHLDDAEVLALGGFLALNPLLVYYSRFMRNDVLVAAFAVFALGFVVRWLRTGLVRYPVFAGVSLALGFAAKENAIVYVLCFLGAGVLVVDHRLFRRTREETPSAVARDWYGDISDRVRAWGDGDRSAGALFGAAGVAASLAAFAAVIVFFYAPRPDLLHAVGDPSLLPGVVSDATVGAWSKFQATWLGPHQSHDYLPYLYDFLETLLFGAPVVIALAAVGFLADGYLRDGGSRGLVAFAVYWGVVSVFGYPIATDIAAPWAVVHAVVPLAFPAAVGFVALVRVGQRALAREDAVAVAAVAFVLLAAVGGVAALNADYWNSTAQEDKQVLQYAQPENELGATLDKVRLVVRHNEGTDVLFYGSTAPYGDSTLFYVEDESSLDSAPPGGPNWHSRLPLPWYLERYDAEVTSTPPDGGDLSDPPPVVVTFSWDSAAVGEELPGYDAYPHRFRLWSQEIVVFVDADALAAARQAT